METNFCLPINVLPLQFMSMCKNSLILIFTCLVVCSTIEVFAQDNPYKAPLYWDSYEYQYTHNDYLPQDVWKEQANWVEKNFKSYGYDMIVADGWIEGSSQTNANGYVLKHHNSWIMTWKDMGEYLKAKGLKFGVVL